VQLLPAASYHSLSRFDSAGRVLLSMIALSIFFRATVKTRFFLLLIKTLTIVINKYKSWLGDMRELFGYNHVYRRAGYFYLFQVVKFN
jgi:hypothetical protein